MTTLINTLRTAANDVREADSALYDDIYDLIGEGAENAADTMGERCDDDSAEFSDLAVSTIAAALCERTFAPRYGSMPAAVRDWFFANGVSF